MQLLLENVRCFYGKHDIPIKPLTFFVGENSSGKTTALAMFSAAVSMNSYALHPYLNIPPFDLGNYETIASRQKDAIPAGRFGIGIVQKPNKNGEFERIYATFVQKEGQPELSELEWLVADEKVRAQIKEENYKLTVHSKKKGDPEVLAFTVPSE